MLMQSPNLQATEACPLVSVVVPAYNAERFIAHTLESVLAQTYHNIEVLVVDDGSQDKTAQVVETYVYRDTRVKLLQQENAGVAAARNLGIRHSKGEFIAPIDADDIWHPTNIEKQVNCILKGGSKVGVVYSWSVDIDESETPTGNLRASVIQGNVFKTLLLHEFIGNASATLVKRDCFDRVGLYRSQLEGQDPTIRYLLCEDWELYLRIAKFYEFRVVSEFLVGYRQLNGSMSCDYLAMAKCHDAILWSTQDRPSKIAQILFNLSKSSLYMYFARQCETVGKPQNTLFWIYKATLAGFLLPVLHPDFYKLLLSSCIGLLTKAPLKASPPTCLKAKTIQSANETREAVFQQNVDIRLRFKFGIEHAVHSSLSYFSRHSQQSLCLKAVTMAMRYLRTG